jgi:hypothetical protein
LAVLMLMLSSNVVGCSTGRSAGFAPLRILSTYVAVWATKVGRVGVVGHQTTRVHHRPVRVERRQSVFGRKFDHSFALSSKNAFGRRQESVSVPLGSSVERGRKVRSGLDTLDQQRHAQRASGALYRRTQNPCASMPSATLNLLRFFVPLKRRGRCGARRCRSQQKAARPPPIRHQTAVAKLKAGTRSPGAPAVGPIRARPGRSVRVRRSRASDDGAQAGRSAPSDCRPCMQGVIPRHRFGRSGQLL